MASYPDYSLEWLFRYWEEVLEICSNSLTHPLATIKIIMKIPSLWGISWASLGFFNRLSGISPLSEHNDTKDRIL